MEKNKKEAIKAKYNLRQYPNGFKMKLIDELVKNSGSDNQIAIGLGMPSGTLFGYKKELLQQLGFFRILEGMKKNQDKEKSFSDIERENTELKKALELAMLKVAGLETLIDVAEDQLNISIRKKSGAKQSK
jgi:transposase